MLLRLKIHSKYRNWRRYRALQGRKKTCHICTKTLDKTQISSTNNSHMHSKIIFRVNNSININIKIKVNHYSRHRNRSSSRVFIVLPLCHYSKTKRLTFSSSSSINPNSILSSSKIRSTWPAPTHKTTLKCLK